MRGARRCTVMCVVSSMLTVSITGVALVGSIRLLLSERRGFMSDLGGSDNKGGQKITVTVKPGREYLPSTPVGGSDERKLK